MPYSIINFARYVIAVKFQMLFNAVEKVTADITNVPSNEADILYKVFC